MSQFGNEAEENVNNVDIDNENAGRYRKENVTIKGATHIPPDYLKLPELMEKFEIFSKISSIAFSASFLKSETVYLSSGDTQSTK